MCACVVIAMSVCLARVASAQAPPSSTTSAEDSRIQYPAFLTDSFFSLNVGSMHHRFSNSQLAPGHQAAATAAPHLAVRVGLFGHRFSKWLSAQATYARPVRFVTYRRIDGTEEQRQVREGFGGVTLLSQVPVRPRLSVYGEGGMGITSRSGIDISGEVLIKDAHFAAALLGAGVEYRMSDAVGMVIGATYSPGRKRFAQPSTRLYTMGLRYTMHQLSELQLAEKRHTDFIFPKHVVQLGYSANAFSYGPNRFFSRVIPVFWDGTVETRRGTTLAYQRNVYHTRRIFAFDLGASASYWKSNGNKETFRALSVYPLFRFTLHRMRRADLYASYSVAGPSYMSRPVIDGQDTGGRFTFQDFMGLGVFAGKNRDVNLEIGIKHYSNGNMFPHNAAIKIPLTLSVGYTFRHRK